MQRNSLGYSTVGLISSLVSLCFLPGAFAAPVNMDLTGVNGNSYAGVYTSPYYATVNGVPTTVICDDFETESSIGQVWQANVTTVASVVAGTSTAKFTPAADYDAVANLATQLLAVSPSSTQSIVLSFAIWDIFDSSGVQKWFNYYGDPQSIGSQASAAATAALGAIYTPGEYSNVVIYTSTTGSPQEFISVTAPEASTPALLAVDLLGFIGLVAFLRKRAAKSVS